MTLKTSFFNLLKHDIKHRLAIFFIAFVVFFFTFPIATAIDADNEKDNYIEISGKFEGQTVNETYYIVENYVLGYDKNSINYVVNDLIKENGIDYVKNNHILIAKKDFNRTIRQINGNNFLLLTGKGNIWIAVVAFIGAIITAMSSFSMLMNRRQTDFYYSLPIKREEWFLIRATSDILFFAVPYLINLVLAMLVMLLFGGISFSAFLLSLVGWLFATMIFILAYSTCCLAGAITGTPLIHFFMINIIFFLAPVIWQLNEFAKDLFFATHYTQGRNDFAFALETKFFSPFSSIFVLIAKCHEAEGMESFAFSDFLALILQIVVFIGLTVFLIKIRKSERAGSAVAFEPIKPIIKIILCCLAGIGGGFIFREIGGGVWLFIGCLLCSLIVYGFTETFYNSDVKKCLAHKKQLCIALALPILILLAYTFDIFGYDRYQPNKKSIESMAVMIPAIDTDSEYRVGYYSRDDAKYILGNMKITDFDKIYDSVTNFVKYNENSEGYVEIHPNSSYLGPTMLGPTMLVPNTDDDVYQVIVRYNLKSGRIVDRKYYIPLSRFQTEVSEIFNSKEYKSANNIFLYDPNIETYGADLNIYSNNGISTSYSATALESSKLITCLREEYSKVTYNEFLNETPLCELDFCVKGGSVKNSVYADIIYEYDDEYVKNYIAYDPSGIHSATFKVYVYPSMKNTISCLENMGLRDYLECDLSSNVLNWIDHLVIKDYEYHLLNNINFDLTPEYTSLSSDELEKYGKSTIYSISNKEEIFQIMQNSIEYRFVNIFYNSGNRYDSLVNITVVTKKGCPYNISNTRYLKK